MIFEIAGLFIVVRKPEIADLPVLSRWLASELYCTNMGGVPSMSEQFYHEQACAMLQANANDRSDKIVYLVFDRFTQQAVALSLLSQIDWKNRHAEHSYLVGEESYRSKMVAGDLNMVMNNYFFSQLNLNKIYSFIFDFNQAALRLTGFGGSAEGILKQHRRYNGVAMDVHVYSITSREFSEFVHQHAAGLLRKHIHYGLLPAPAC